MCQACHYTCCDARNESRCGCNDCPNSRCHDGRDDNERRRDERDGDDAPAMEFAWSCRSCGCTDTHACPGACYWIRPGLCSACADRQADELVEAALDWAHLADPPEFSRELNGRRFDVSADRDSLVVRDHIALPVLIVSREGYSLMPHYDAAELMPLFEAR